MNAIPKPRQRHRPTTQEGTAMQSEIDRLNDAAAIAEQTLDAMRRRIAKWSGLALLIGFLLGAIAGRVFV